MITLSNGHSFEFMAASGSMAYDGQGWPWEWPLRWVGLLDPRLFTIVVKTLTLEPRKGHLRWTHPWSVVRRLGRNGVLNAVGLTNPGIDWWMTQVAPHLSKTLPIVVSIEARDDSEITEMIGRLNTLVNRKKIVGIELNLSCPNTPDRLPQSSETILALCRKAAAVSAFPLIAKLSVTHDYAAIARALAREQNFQAFSINSIPWPAFTADRTSPLARYGGGGVSGKLIQPQSWKMVSELAQSTPIPVIGPSVWDYEDIDRVRERGAKAVSFGSVFVFYPWRPTRFVRRWLKTRK